jgi:predicted dehydrogenase/threonine dehydrogenase-like Zn-dependent dehydrogenase
VKQILQLLRTGVTEVAEVPAPAASRGSVLIRTSRTLVSAGTERMLVDFSKAGLLGKARAQPEKVRQVLDKIRTDGLLPTMEAVFKRLDEPLPLGYCNAGVVLAVGPGVTELQPGDRVASNGPHAEVVCVPKNLCAKIPDNVSDEQAAFTVLSSIGLQGVRLIQPNLGERIVVVGLGLIGLVTVQLLRACGCAVLGIDLNPRRLALAERFGATVVRPGGDPLIAASAWADAFGVDGVVICASAKTDEIVHQAAQMCRRRGRIVLVGVVGLNLRRADFYEKELTFQVSCSYGPGRYDEKYEQGGQDYPPAFVRWTEQRNFNAVLTAMQSGQLKVDELVTHRFELAEAPAAYACVSDDPSALGVVLRYPGAPATVCRRTGEAPVGAVSAAGAGGQPTVGVIGAGNFAKMTLMPALAKTPARVAYVADLNGVAAQHLVTKYGAGQAVTDFQVILQDPAVKGIFIAVGHNLHARFICEVLAAGKWAFVEKPLALSPDEVRQVIAALRAHPEQQLMVGFNRRFSPFAVKMRELLAGRSEPLAMNFTANAGTIPPGHWVHDPVRGGGRIIGEACHYLDLMVFLAGAPISSVAAVMMGRGVGVKEDKMSLVVSLSDGSIGTVNYFANGSKSYPKEQMEVFSEGRVLKLDNFRRMDGYGFRGFHKLKSWRQDKGHAREFAVFIDHLAQGGPPLIPVTELVNVTLASFAAMTSAREGRTVRLADEYRDMVDAKE